MLPVVHGIRFFPHLAGVFNPFKQLSTSDLDAFVEAGYFFLVAQHHKRAFDNYTASDKTALLITPYKIQADAQYHLDNLQDKRHSALIHLNHQTHFLRMQQLLSETSQYLLFNSQLHNLDEVLKKSLELFKPKILSYLNRNADIEQVVSLKQTTELKLQYGEFYIAIGSGFDKQLIRLDIIENS